MSKKRKMKIFHEESRLADILLFQCGLSVDWIFGFMRHSMGELTDDESNIIVQWLIDWSFSKLGMDRKASAEHLLNISNIVSCERESMNGRC